MTNITPFGQDTNFSKFITYSALVCCNFSWLENYMRRKFRTQLLFDKIAFVQIMLLINPSIFFCSYKYTMELNTLFGRQRTHSSLSSSQLNFFRSYHRSTINFKTPRRIFVTRCMMDTFHDGMQ